MQIGIPFSPGDSSQTKQAEKTDTCSNASKHIGKFLPGYFHRDSFVNKQTTRVMTQDEERQAMINGGKDAAPGLPPFIMPAYRRSEEWQALRDRTDETRVLLDNARRYRESDVPERFVVEGWSLANMREPPKCTRTLAGKHFDGSAIKAFLNNILEGKPRTAVFRAKEYISIVIVNNDSRPIDGQIVLSDGTIARFRNGLRPKGLELRLK